MSVVQPTAKGLLFPDDFYELLIEMHRELDEQASQRVNASLILLMANQIGDLDTLRAMMLEARRIEDKPQTAPR